jgi:hypothetical protein
MASTPPNSGFWLLSRENIFPQNEAKLCPSLLGFFKKRSQNEPKPSQIEAKKSQFSTPRKPT